MKKVPIPSSFTQAQVMFLRDLMNTIEGEVDSRIGKNVGTDQLLLVSPSRKIYAVKVNDDGDLVAELVKA